MNRTMAGIVAMCGVGLLVQGCATYIKGDLSERNITRGEFDFHVSDIKETGLHRYNERNMSTERFLERVHLTTHTSASTDTPIQVHLDYRISDSYWGSGCMPALTMLTLGLIPFYSTGDADVHVELFRGGSLVYRTKVDSRAHTFSGLLPLWIAERRSSPDALQGAESSPTSDVIQKEVRARIFFRIARLLEDDHVYYQVYGKTRNTGRGQDRRAGSRLNDVLPKSLGKGGPNK